MDDAPRVEPSCFRCSLAVGGCAAEKAERPPLDPRPRRLKASRASKPNDLKSKIALEKTSWIPLSPKHYLDPFAGRRRQEAHRGLLRRARLLLRARHQRRGQADQGRQGGRHPARRRRRARRRKINDAHRRWARPASGPRRRSSIAASSCSCPRAWFRSRQVPRAEGRARDAAAQARLRLGRRQRRGRRRPRRASRPTSIFKVDPGPKARVGHVYVRGYEVIDPQADPRARRHRGGRRPSIRRCSRTRAAASTTSASSAR